MEQNKTILVVDDDAKIRLLLRRCLESDGYRVVEAETEAEVVQQLASNTVDLITLDLQLGAENGLHIAAKVRETSNVPIVMVTGKGDVIDKVVGLEIGADDYIAKPFHLREVQARIRSAIRRNEMVTGRQVSEDPVDQTFVFNGWVANFQTYELKTPSGEVCDMTTTDFKLLMLFLNAPKRVLSRDQIMDQLSGSDWAPYDRTFDNQVARLRKKIELDPARPQIIKTVRGIGYTFVADVEKVSAA